MAKKWPKIALWPPEIRGPGILEKHVKSTLLGHMPIMATFTHSRKTISKCKVPLKPDLAENLKKDPFLGLASWGSIFGISGALQILTKFGVRGSKIRDFRAVDEKIAF